jgi:argininosuccinate synthase
VVQINGKDVTPLEAMMLANEIGGRNGIGMKHALENRIIGTKSRGVYEAPGMELLGTAIRYVYQATMDRRATLFFTQLSKLITDEIYDGRYYDPTCVAARNAVDTLAQYADGTVKLSLYKGNIIFDALTDCPHTIYNEADSSMEASDGVNPVSSQGFAEIQSVEARMLALSGQIEGR